MQWRPIQLDGIFRDWSVREPSHGKASLQRSKSHAPVSIERVEVVTIRAVKRNPFPASYLKQKPANRVSVGINRKRVKACGSSILDITRNQGLLLNQCHGLRGDRQQSRRPRSERRKDWNVAIAGLVGHNCWPAHLIPTELASNLPCPVLSTGLKMKQTESLTMLHTIAPRLQRKPKRSIRVANIISNLWFDVELLLRTAKTGVQKSLHYYSRHEITLMRCMEYFQFCASVRGVGIFVDASPAEHRSIEAPILCSTQLKNYSRLEKLRIGGERLSENRITFSFIQASLSEIDKASKILQFSYSDVNDFLAAFRTSQEECCKRAIVALSDKIQQVIDFGNDIKVEDFAFSRDITFTCGGLEMPVTKTGFLASKRVPSHVLGHQLQAAERQTSLFKTHFDEVSRFVKNRYTYERGYWCLGSREILDKSQYSRPEILRQIPSLSIKVLTRSLNGLPPRDVVTLPAPQSVERDNELFTFFRKAKGQQQFPSRRWKKFSRALMEDAREERRSIEDLRMQRIRDKLDSFDPPNRRRSPAYRELIQSMYTCTQKNTFPKGPTQSNLEVQEDSSDYSILDDLYLSDEDTAERLDCAAAVGTLIGIAAGNNRQTNEENGDRNMDGRIDYCPDVELEPSRLCSRRKGRASNQSPSKMSKSPVRLRAPENMVCSPSSLQIAEHCLQYLKRGVLFLPPPLSVLPTIAAVSYSYLSAALCDHRVAIICEPGTDMRVRAASYLEFTYRRSVSIDVVQRADLPCQPRLASLAKKTARVLILDSFDFALSVGFALLIVLGPGGATSCNSIEEESIALSTELCNSVSNLRSIPSILIVPYYPNNNLVDYSQKTTELAKILGLTEALFIEDRDDIHHLTLLSRPNVLFLVPSREVIELIAVLETTASVHIPAYQSLRQLESQGLDTRRIRFLREVNVVSLEKYLEGRRQPQGATSGNDLEVLYSLRQARSYALYDGFNTAVEYLEHYARRATSQTLSALQSVLEEVHGLFDSSTFEDSQRHPMTIALEKSFKSMEQDMLSHVPSLQSIHRRSKFRPLVITSSKEAYDGLMCSLNNARDILEAGEGDCALCEIGNLWDAKGSKETSYGHQAYKACMNFSHVYHVINDRNRQVYDDFLPPHLLQYIHAGRTRLLTIAVDETRTMESKHNRNEVLYGRLAAGLQTTNMVVNPSRKHAYIKKVTLKDVLTVMDSLAPPSKRPEQTNRERIQDQGTHTAMIRSERTVIRNPASKDPNEACPNEGSSKMQISVTEICHGSITGLRSMLKEALESIRRQNQNMLQVIVNVGAHERCSPATTFIFSAIAGDGDLHSHVRVLTKLHL